VLSGLKHWWSIRGIQRRRTLILRAYAKDIAAAKEAKKSATEIYKIESDEHEELRFVEDERDVAESQRLCALAFHYRVPIPQAEGDWEQSRIFGMRHLSRAAAAKVRTDIRVEQKAKWDYWQSRLQLVGTVVGIVGGLMGALAFFKQPPPHP
jgi:hypothetical protein